MGMDNCAENSLGERTTTAVDFGGSLPSLTGGQPSGRDNR